MSLPTASPLRWNSGEHVQILDESRGKTLWRVSKRVAGGWLLEETTTRKVDTFTDAQIRLLRLDERLHHFPANAALVSERQMDLMVTPRAFWSKRVELIVDVKLAYCLFVDERVESRRSKGEACHAAVVPARKGDGTLRRDGSDPGSPRQADGGTAAAGPVDAVGETLERSVHSVNYKVWRRRFEKLRIGEEATRTNRALPETELETVEEDGDDYYDFSKVPWFLRPPHWRTVSDWHSLWLKAGKSEGILQPDDANKGNRVRRVHEILMTPDGGKDVYEIMGKYLEDLHLDEKRVPLSKVWDVITTAHPEFETFFTNSGPLARVLKKKYPHSYDRQKRRDGVWKANNDHRVSQVHPDPEHVMDELEIDHCLADLVVCDDKGNTLGRPWITAMLDRCSRMIVGMHVSFEVPSYASVQRCLMHAFWPKDLRRWKPGHPDFDPERELSHDWPCEGLPKAIYTDRGKEFLSIALDRVGWSLGIRILPLPARSPWLKGKIERFFGTMHVKVYSHEEGKTFSSHAKRLQYKSFKKADMTLRDLKWSLLKWVVDDYHPSYHDGLSGHPLFVWHQKVGQSLGPVSA